MKPATLLLLIVLLVCACRDSEKPITICMTFHPAFHRAMEITLTTNKEHHAIGCLVFSLDSASGEAAFDAADISPSLLAGFWQQVDTLSLLQIPSPGNLGFDGMVIAGTITTGDSTHAFSSWSPRRQEEPQLYKLMDAVFELTDSLPHLRTKEIADVRNYLEKQ